MLAVQPSPDRNAPLPCFAASPLLKRLSTILSKQRKPLRIRLDSCCFVGIVEISSVLISHLTPCPLVVRSVRGGMGLARCCRPLLRLGAGRGGAGRTPGARPDRARPGQTEETADACTPE